MLYKHGMAIEIMNSLQLWLPTQDRYKIKPTRQVNVPVKMNSALRRESYMLGRCIGGVREKC